MSNWSFAMNGRCYENDYIRAWARILALKISSRALQPSLSLPRFIDDEFSILILSFGTLASRFSEDSLCIGAVLCECWICMYTHSVYAGCIFFYIHTMCNVHVHEHCSIVQCKMFSVHIRSYHRSYHRLSLDLCSTFFLFCLQKIECFSAKTCCGLNETKRTIKWSSNFTVSGSYLNVIIASPLHIDTSFISLSLSLSLLICFQNDNSKKVTTTMRKNTHERKRKRRTTQYWHENTHFTCTITRACKEKRKD